ncbi:DinB family protein [Solitalea koreensis]|uniref:DinB superfamily protein n=1 Tax=Solitalea koreensis TaxID=543615 RepID=A0A521CRY7_9SPHI|nr:DinB family protein [Solitalea koreensis]SMO62239.1 DinB superfamily protein [Solitalea koreensis]
MARPNSSTYAPYYETYIKKVPEDNVNEALKKNTEVFLDFLENLPEAKSDYAYAPGKWTLKEVLLHLSDAERIFSYRALRIARNDQTPLAGFEEDEYVPYSNASYRTLASIIDELKVVRTSTQILFNSFNADALDRMGTASNHPVGVCALGFIIAGHTYHHMQIIKERYL